MKRTHLISLKSYGIRILQDHHLKKTVKQAKNKEILQFLQIYKKKHIFNFEILQNNTLYIFNFKTETKNTA